jgi:hypothetical protein
MAVVIDGTNGVSSPDYEVDGVTGQLYPIVRGTAITLTNQTAPGFTGIPSWVKRITLMFQGVSANSTGVPLIQIGTGSTTYVTSGYLGSGVQFTDGSSVNALTSTTGFQIRSAAAANTFHGAVTITNVSGNNWAASGFLTDSSRNAGYGVAGSIALGAALTAVRLFIDGTQLFDAGTINILYE